MKNFLRGGNIFVGGFITEAQLKLNDKAISTEAFSLIMNEITGFHGCIHSLSIGSRKINFEKDSMSTANVKKCEQR